MRTDRLRKLDRPTDRHPEDGVITLVDHSAPTGADQLDPTRPA
jgi:hypothetical protein